MIDKIIIRKIGLKYNMTDDEVYELIQLSYRFVKETIESGDRENLRFKNVKMPGLGTFYVSEHYKNYRKRQKDGN